MYQNIELYSLIFLWCKVWSKEQVQLLKFATSNQNLNLQIISSVKVMNTRVEQLIKSNNSYFGHLSIRQSDSKIVQKSYNLS